MKFRLPAVSKIVDRLIQALGILLLVLAVLAGMMYTRWFRQLVERQVRMSLEQTLGAQVQLQGVDIRPLSLRISVQHLLMRGREKASGAPLLSAREVTASIDPASIWELRPVLHSLAWQEADIHLETYADGTTNLPGARQVLPNGKPQAKLMDLKVRQLSLAHTTVIWNNRIWPLELAARDVAIQLRLNREHQYLGTLASSDTTLSWNSRNLPPLTFASTFQVSSHGLQVTSLSWQLANLRGELSGTFHWEPRFAGEFRFRSNGGLQQLAKSLGEKTVQKGYVFLDGQGSYGEDGLALQGRVEARQLEIKRSKFNPGLLSAAANYAWAGQLLELKNLTLTTFMGRARGSATVSFRQPAPRVKVEAAVFRVNLSALLNSVPEARGVLAVFHPQAQVNGRVLVDWQSRAAARGTFALQFSPYPRTLPGTLPVSGTAQGSFALRNSLLLNLQNADFRTPHSELQAEGSFGPPQSALNLKVVTTDFNEWRPLASTLVQTQQPIPLTLKSTATFTGGVTGSWASPEIQGHLDTGAFIFSGWGWDRFQADILGTRNETRIGSGRLKLGSSTLTLDGQAELSDWMLRDSSVVHLKVSTRETPVAGLRAALKLQPSMRGLVTGRAQVDGSLQNLSGQGEFEVQKGEFAGIPFDLLTAELRASEAAWEITRLNIREGNGRAAGRVRFDSKRRSFFAELHGRDFQLNRFHVFPPGMGNSPVPGPISGVLSMDVSGQGSFDNARVQSSLEICQLAWKGQPLGQVHGSAVWQGDRIELHLQQKGAAGNIQVSGDMQTRGDWPFQLTGQYADWRVDPWIEELANRSLGAPVLASGTISASGPLRQSSRITGSSQVQRLVFSFPEMKMTNQHPFRIRYGDHRLTLDWFRMQGVATDLELGGNISFAEPRPVDLTARGRAAATLMSMLSAKIQATGASTLTVHVGGTIQEPQLTGTVEVKDVSMGYGDLPLRVSALNGSIKLQSVRAVISSMTGNIGGGNVSFSGYAALQDVLRYRIGAKLSQVRVRYPSDFTTLLDGDLTLRGTTERGQLSGEINVRNIFANENLDLMNLLAGSTTPLPSPTLEVTLPYASSVNVNVQIGSVRPVRLETHNLRLVTDIDTRVQGTLAQPVVVGTVYLRSGEAVFRGNRYTLTRGEISMTNPFETEPVVDLQVQTRIDKYDLTLIVSGPLDRIRLSYRSDPPLPSEDIVSLLALGYSKRVEEFAPGSRNPVSSVGASAMLSQALSNQVTGRVQRLFGVSRVKLAPYSDQPGTMGSPVLTIEQQLSPQLTITYQTTTANSQYRVYEFEWNVNPRMSVRGFRDQNGIIGLELKFRKRFK